MRKGGRWEKFSSDRIGIVENSGDLIEHRVRWPMINSPANHEIRILLADHFVQQFQMITRPDIVVTQVGDVRSVRDANTFIIRRCLAARITQQVFPENLLAEFGFEKLFGAVPATISHNNDFEVPISLLEHGADGVFDPCRRVVARNDDGKEGLASASFKHEQFPAILNGTQLM